MTFDQLRDWKGAQAPLLSTALKLAGAAIVVYALCEPWRIAVREHEVALPDLPREAEGLRIAQLSDIHAGMLMPRALVRRIVSLCAACKPDVVVITGDVVNRRRAYPPPLRPLARRVTEYAEELAQELEHLKPPLGIYAAPGNHDLWEGSFGPIAEILARGQRGFAAQLQRAIAGRIGSGWHRRFARRAARFARSL